MCISQAIMLFALKNIYNAHAQLYLNKNERKKTHWFV